MNLIDRINRIEQLEAELKREREKNCQLRDYIKNLTEDHEDEPIPIETKKKMKFKLKNGNVAKAGKDLLAQAKYIKEIDK